jgi:hypothetical protein
MIIGWNVATYSPGLLGPIDEVRISYLNRLYTYPTTGPLVKDVYTQCLYEFDITPPVNTGQAPVYTVTVPNPAAGSNWSYTLLVPARLKSASAILSCSAGAATRYPIIQPVAGGVLVADVSLTPAGLTANQVGVCSVWSGAALVASAVGGGVIIANAPWPDEILPAGATIGSYVYGIQTADQWSSIGLTFSAE